MSEEREDLQNRFVSHIDQLKRSDTHQMHAALFISQLGLLEQLGRAFTSFNHVSNISFFLQQISYNQL